MKNVLLEVGKSLLIFGNLGTILLFLREFLITHNNQNLMYAILFMLVSYAAGSILIFFPNSIRSNIMDNFILGYIVFMFSFSVLMLIFRKQIIKYIEKSNNQSLQH